MSALKMGFYSMMGFTGLLLASNALATNATIPSTGKTGMVEAVSSEVKIRKASSMEWRMEDSKGNVYLLTPLNTEDCKSA